MKLNGKSKRIEIKAFISDYEKSILQGAVKHGTLRITKKRGHYIAQIALELPIEDNTLTNIMGIDLGIKVPAVCCTDNNRVKFVGNGRMNKYVRRYHQNRRKKLGKEKKLKAIKKSQDKERWMKDQDHKISREIINFALLHEIGIIRLEQLSNIRKQTRKSRKKQPSVTQLEFLSISLIYRL